MAGWGRAFAGGLAILVAGCATPASPPPRDLSAVCQVRACRCVAIERSLFSSPATTDVEWPDRGPPQCPTGFRLELDPGRP